MKSINQWFNKQIAQYTAHVGRSNHSHKTRRVLRLSRQRSNKLADILHQTSHRLISYCQAQQVETIVIGYNPHWKQGCHLGTRTNQSFVQIPFLKLVQMLEYKARRVGIAVVRLNEAYTSQRCSQCGLVSKTNRQSRGLYVCNECGVRLNADHNAARNILAKYYETIPVTQVVPRESPILRTRLSPDSGCVTHPVGARLTSV